MKKLDKCPCDCHKEGFLSCIKCLCLTKKLFKHKECKTCGLLKTTIDSLKPGDKWFHCVEGRSDHDFGDEKEILPCPHGRLPMNGQDGWKHCPHCLGLSSLSPSPAYVADFLDEEGEFENLFPRHTQIQKQFISALLAKNRNQIKTDLLKIADAGEFENMRREIERYFTSDKH